MSISLSKILFMLIANDLAPIIARIIQKSVFSSGRPFPLVKSAPDNANGNAKIECSNLMRLKRLRSLVKNIVLNCKIYFLVRGLLD